MADPELWHLVGQIGVFTDDELALHNKRVKRFSVEARPSEEAKYGLLSFIPGCPHGLEYLVHTNAVYVRPFSGPHVVGHFSSSNQFELLNCEGKRILIVTSNMTTKSELRLSDENPEVRKLYPVYMGVLNYMEEEIFQYYGVPGKVLRVGPRGEPSWGTIVKVKGKKSRPSSSRLLRYDVIIDDHESRKKKSMEKQATYVIEGEKKTTWCPTESTKKLYYGTFDCNIFEADKWRDDSMSDVDPIGKIQSCLRCQKFQYTFPGVEFPYEMDVFHKAVILGSLFVDIVRKNW